MAVVVLPTMMRASVGGAKRIEVEAATVAQLVIELQRRYPELRAWLDNGLGGLPEFMSIFVAAEDIRIREGMATRLEPQDEVILVPVMSGGQR